MTTAGILAERARALAQPRMVEASDEVALLAFAVGGLTHAVAVDAVREVAAQAEVTRLPWSDPAIAGVANLRGDLVLVADLARLLGLGQARDGGPVVVLSRGSQLVALCVDALEDLTSVPACDIAARQRDPDHDPEELIAGVTPTAIVIDPDAVFALVHTKRVQEKR